MAVWRRINEIEPGASSHMDIEANDRMCNSYNTGPYSDVSPQVAGNRHPLFAKHIPWTNEQRSDQQKEGRISCDETYLPDDIFLWQISIEPEDAKRRGSHQRKVVSEQAVDKSIA